MVVVRGGQRPNVKMIDVSIEAILFDLGRVIVDFDMNPTIETLTGNSPLERRRFEEILWDTGWIRRYERGEVSTRDFYDFLRRDAGLEMAYEDFYPCWAEVFQPELIVSEDLLAALSRRYPMGLVSNTNEAHAEHIRVHYGVFEHFDHHILSYQVGSLKPDRKIFECAIEAMGKEPERLLFIDDREENVSAGSQLGMRTHRFESLAGLGRALQDVGIDVGDLIHLDTDID